MQYHQAVELQNEDRVDEIPMRSADAD